MNKILLSFFLLFSGNAFSQVGFSSYVDPFIGTGGHGHTFPGATLPFGMVQLSPDTRIDGSWDGCSGYHASDTIIYGFSHTHLSGTGVSDYGDMMLMPMMNPVSFDPKIYSSRFSHSSEKASPGYYAVKLLDDDINVELTVSERVGLHKYIFGKTGKAGVVLDLNHRDKLLAGVIKIINPSTIEVYRVSDSWAKNQKLYARIEFSRTWAEIKNPEEGSIVKSDPWDRVIKSAFVFNVKAGDSLFVKVTLSTTGVKGASRNGMDEVRTFDFEKVRKNAVAVWDKNLGRVAVVGDEKRKKIFYTALYHCMIHPNISMDVDSMYRGFDDQVYKSKDRAHYTVFSLWDTFRALHPLFTILETRRTVDFIRTFLDIYDKGGRLPVWELASNETDCMIGYHSASVIADAYSKSIKDFDADKALEAMQKSANWKHLGIPEYKDHGFISSEEDPESVSKTLEYAYDDWCIAQFALLNNKTPEYEYYQNRAQHWRNCFDPSTGFMRPRYNGTWLSPFDPKRVDNNFTEANSWQYSFFVPHDIPGLMDMMGGAIPFENKLDELFTTGSKTSGRDQSDITGLIGQYAHGNEPSHANAYLYNFIGKPWKTQERVSQIMNDFYTTERDGLIGNEDCGQMSAWLVLSAMGIYQVTPGMPIYQIGTPWFNEVKIYLENRKVFEINAKNISAKNFYVQSAQLNGEDHSRSWLTHADIMKGGKISFEMGPNKNEYWASESFNLLDPQSPENPLNPAPLISFPSRSFNDSIPIDMQSVLPGNIIYYTLDGSRPNIQSAVYDSIFYLDSTAVIMAASMNEMGSLSFPSKAFIYKRKHPDRKVKIKSKYNVQYTAGGDEGIIDGLRGSLNWRKGDWQGYQSQDFEAMVDFGKEEVISKVGAGFLQDTRSWILFPSSVEIELSVDGLNYKKVASIVHAVKDSDTNVQMSDLVQAIAPQMARYLRIKAINYGSLPSWHQGKGGDAFIFIDEIIAE